MSFNEKEYQAEYRAAHREEARIYSQSYRVLNKTKNAIRKKANYDKDPEKYLARTREWNLLHPDYGRQRGWKRAGIKLTPKEYDVIYNKQEGKCDICGKHQTKQKKKLAVDHDHDTGQVRGLLCNRCNLGISWFEDDPDWVVNAVDYLDKER